MNLSDTSSFVTLLLGAVTLCVWLWKLLSWFRKKHIEAKKLADEGSRLAQLLLNHATSPAKRSDIYFFMNLRAIESTSRQTNATVYSIAAGGFISVLSISWALLTKFFNVDYTHPLIIFTLATFVCLVVSFFMSLWFSFNLSRLENGWQVGAMQAIVKKIAKHVPDA